MIRITITIEEGAEVAAGRPVTCGMHSERMDETELELRNAVVTFEAIEAAWQGAMKEKGVKHAMMKTTR